MNNKKAFSFVEIIITISIIALLSVIGFSAQNSYNEKMNNSKIISDINTINNALESFLQETQSLPMPWGNNNFFTNDTTYAHWLTSTGVFWVYGKITEDTIPKKYLDILPLDPRTNSYYSYGKTLKSNEFELASVNIINTIPVAKVIWNYKAENGPYNLIRAYNWPNFVTNDSKLNLPYNPDELILIATDINWKIYREWDTITTTWDSLELFFSDWSVSILEENSILTLDTLSFPSKNNLNTIVKLALWAGTIWTRATDLNNNSEFEIHTSNTVAAVRWTIFWVEINWTDTITTVIEGQVDIYEINQGGVASIIVTEEVTGWKKLKTWDSITDLNNIEIVPDFRESDDKDKTKDKLALIEREELVSECEDDYDLNPNPNPDEKCIKNDIWEWYKLVYYKEYPEAWDTINWVNLSSNYAIEMKIDDLDEITSPQYLFSNESGSWITLLLGTIEVLLFKDNPLCSNNIPHNNIPICWFNYNNGKVIFKSWVDIKILWNEFSITDNLTINDLTIWRKNWSTAFELKEEIEYIKIYKR